MAQYFMDCEFLEGTQNKTFLGMNVGKTKPTIDLISIGIVSDDGREYYAISKDFNLKEAWNRWQYDEKLVSGKNQQGKYYWLRENVLKPIFREWYAVHNNVDPTVFDHKFTYKEFKRLLNKYGKTNKQIAEEIEMFTTRYVLNEHAEHPMQNSIKVDEIEFYAYYADYDWVTFCWLFGKMIDLPKGFPMYCIDLKQEIERLNEELGYNMDSNGKSYKLQEKPNFPKQTNEHSAIYDARWNKELYKFLKETII